MTAQNQSHPDAGVALAELPRAARYALRLRPEGVAAVGAALGLELPARIGGISSGGGWRALRLGPDEWQIDGPAGPAPELPADPPHALVEVTDREVTWRLEGPRAIDLLSIGIARDLRRIAPGSGRRTVFDGVQAVLVREAEDAFTLSVWRSFAPHVLDLLTVGIRELRAGV